MSIADMSNSKSHYHVHKYKSKYWLTVISLLIIILSFTYNDMS